MLTDIEIKPTSLAAREYHVTGVVYRYRGDNEPAVAVEAYITVEGHRSDTRCLGREFRRRATGEEIDVSEREWADACEAVSDYEQKLRRA